MNVWNSKVKNSTYHLVVVLCLSVTSGVAQEIDSLVIAKYEVLNRNYENAINIYNSCADRMGCRDRTSELICYFKLGDWETFCNKIYNYKIPLDIVEQYVDDVELFKPCFSVHDSSIIYNFNDLRIHNLYFIDQYIRSSTIVDSQLIYYFDFYFIPNELTSILKSLVEESSSINGSSYSKLEVLLLHQVRTESFFKENEKRLELLLVNNIIDVHQYAIFIDNYHYFNFNKQIYGTWPLWEGDLCVVDVYAPESLDMRRLNLGLPKFSSEPMFVLRGKRYPMWYKL